MPWSRLSRPQRLWIFCSAPEMTAVSKPKMNPASAEVMDQKISRFMGLSGRVRPSCWTAATIPAAMLGFGSAPGLGLIAGTGLFPEIDRAGQGGSISFRGMEVDATAPERGKNAAWVSPSGTRSLKQRAMASAFREIETGQRPEKNGGGEGSRTPVRTSKTWAFQRSNGKTHDKHTASKSSE